MSPRPCVPLHAHSYHGVYLQSMDPPPPPPPSSAGPPDDHDERVSGTHRFEWLPRPCLPPFFRVPSTPGSFFLCSFHLGATTTTTTTTTTIVTTPRRQATTGNHFFHVSPHGGTDLGRDVNLSPPRFGRRQTGTSQSLSVLSRLNGMSCVMETLCSKGSDTLFLSVSLC